MIVLMLNISIQSAKNIYESLLADSKNATSLVHIQVNYWTIFQHSSHLWYKCTTIHFFCLISVSLQFLRFLRRTEGIESARKYFVEAHKSPTCTYHVFVAFAMMDFCIDKDPKVINIFFSRCWLMLITQNN